MITFVITGTLTEPRKNLVDLIQGAGGVYSAVLTAKTDYLVAGTDAGSKLDRARELGVEVIDEKALRTMIRRGLPIRGTEPSEQRAVELTTHRTIYHFYTESYGENEAMFDDQFNLLDAWHCNDATFRHEYMCGWLKKLGIVVKDLPESRDKAAVAAICKRLGYDPDEVDEDATYD